jgi:hypothetical protein
MAVKEEDIQHAVQSLRSRRTAAASPEDNGVDR